MLTVYGIKNCDTVKKALKWLDDKGVAYTFHDLRADGLTPQMAKRWIDALGWESALNRRSTTWRGLPGAAKETLDATTAVQLLVDNPTLVKRPVFEASELIVNGFTDDTRAKIV